MKRFKKIAFLVFSVSTLVACKNNEPEDSTAFDKGALLINIADNIIIPAVDDFDSKIESLQNDFNTFNGSKTTNNFTALKNSWKDAYYVWQAVKTYDFGPMRDNGLKGSIGTYPSDTALINSNIANGGYNLNTFSNVDACGLSALDYLLYRNDALNILTNTEDVTYLGDVISKLKTESSALKTEWSNYRNTFVASTGTSSTSVFSELVNEFNRDYELAKNAKLGIPIGKKSLGIPMLDFIEAPYSEISLTLLNENVMYLHRLFKGNSYNSAASGQGFDDYLNHLEQGSLTNTINNNFDEIESKAQSFTNTLSYEIQNNISELDNLYALMQQQVVYLKTDMTSAFGVLITYQDNDGD